MLEQYNSTNILFLDIETVPAHPSFAHVDLPIAELWKKKCSTFREEEKDPEANYNRAGIYAEFGKIVCISCGCFTSDGKFRLKSYYDDNETALLNSFKNMLDKSFCSSDKILCGHNAKEFDFPYICRRMLINGISLPAVLQIQGKKPWEICHLDTLELWKFGDYKAFTSLNLLAAVFGIPTPKDDIDGSMVWKVYWEEKDLKRIATYCQKDVLTVAQVFRKFRGEPLIDEMDVIYA